MKDEPSRRDDPTPEGAGAGMLEPIRRPLPGLRDIAGGFSATYLANALIAFVFAASAPVAIVLGVGVQGGLTQADMASWIFASFALNGVLTLVLTFLYRTPLICFWTIPGTVLVGPALQHLSFAEVIGAFHATGLLLLVLGLTGSVRRIMALVPMPIIMGMVAGVFLRFGVEWIGAFTQDLWIALPMTAAYFLVPLVPALARRLPPMIAVLIVGVVALALTGGGAAPGVTVEMPGTFAAMLAAPNLYIPAFSWQAMVELVIPLAITVIAAQNAQGIAILRSIGHTPPVNAITTACGVGSIVTAACGAVSTCLTGPSNAIACSSGEPRGHYIAAMLTALLAILFGLFSPLFTSLMLATPPAFIATLAGLALLKVLQGAFQISFSGRFALGALVTFMVTIADHAIFNIGAPFWGLVFGMAVSWLVEREDFRAGDDA